MPGLHLGHSYLRLLHKCRLNLGGGNNGIYQRVKHFDDNLWDDFPVQTVKNKDGMETSLRN